MTASPQHSDSSQYLSTTTKLQLLFGITYLEFYGTVRPIYFEPYIEAGVRLLPNVLVWFEW